MDPMFFAKSKNDLSHMTCSWFVESKALVNLDVTDILYKFLEHLSFNNLVYRVQDEGYEYDPRYVTTLFRLGVKVTKESPKECFVIRPPSNHIFKLCQKARIIVHHPMEEHADEKSCIYEQEFI
jgi:hypothetical protein